MLKEFWNLKALFYSTFLLRQNCWDFLQKFLISDFWLKLQKQKENLDSFSLLACVKFRLETSYVRPIIVVNAGQMPSRVSCGGAAPKPKSGGAPPPPVVSRPGCSDSNELCNFWASVGECQKNSNWMRSNCQAACNSCGTSGSNNTVDFLSSLRESHYSNIYKYGEIIILLTNFLQKSYNKPLQLIQRSLRISCASYIIDSDREVFCA